MNIRRMERIIDKYEIISFDIFDTLLKRDVYAPGDVFELVQREYSRRFKKGSEFKRSRIEAERRAREKSEFEEVTLNEIYEELNITDKDTYKSLELEIEADVLHCNYEIKALFDRCIEHGKRIYVISDMYLPKDFLEEMLCREGFSGYKAVILSSEYRKTKRSGDLYKAFLEEIKVDAKSVLHIGDSRYADYIGPKKCGIKAFHIPRRPRHTLYMKEPKKGYSFDEGAFYAFLNSRVKQFRNRSEQLGYEVLGPIVYGYCTWMQEQFEKVDIPNKKLWLAARDMYLFDKANKIISGESQNSQYVFISRKSLRPVLTVATGDITESGNAFSRGECTLEALIKRMGYSIEDLKTVDVDFNQKVDPRNLSKYPDVKATLSTPFIWEKEKKAAELGMEYLKQQGLLERNIVLADVGWHGTTQYILKRILEAHDSGTKIFGLYLGCLDSTNEKIGQNNYRAFAFNEKEDAPFAKGILLFETLILAPHGSTTGYVLDQQNVIPRLGQPDNVSDYVTAIQAGALQFVKEYKESILSSNLRLDADICTKPFCSLAMAPLKDELRELGELDYDDFGLAKVASPKSLVFYLANPKELFYELKHSPWRVGFLYRLFRVRLPYGKIYSFFRTAVARKQT